MTAPTEEVAAPQDAVPGVDSLDALAAEAQALEGAAIVQQQAAESKAEQAAVGATARDLRAALGMARMMAAPAFAWWPDFGACWSDAQLDAISEAGAEVMQRHGVSMGEVMAKWGPYVALGMATLPPGLATYQAIKAREQIAAQQGRAAGGSHQQAQS